MNHPFPDPETLFDRIKEAAGNFKQSPQATEDQPLDEVREPDKKELWADEVRRLTEARVLLEKRQSFRSGDVIAWKPGLRNRNSPAYDRPAVVMEVLKKPIVVDAPANSPHFRENFDLKILVLDSDKDCAEFYVDGRRFQKVAGRE